MFEIKISAWHLRGRGLIPGQTHSSCERGCLRFPPTLHYKSPNIVSRVNNVLVDTPLSIQYLTWWGAIPRNYGNGSGIQELLPAVTCTIFSFCNTPFPFYSSKFPLKFSVTVPSIHVIWPLKFKTGYLLMGRKDIYTYTVTQGTHSQSLLSSF
jgi:hypothetical protein